jgi:thiol-disulfide isomerase/thioredoxin
VSVRAGKALAFSGFALVVIAALWATSSVQREDTTSGSEPRRSAPDFSLPLLSGLDFALSEHRGRAVIIDFWATWCGPCEVQMPVLDALWKRRRGEDLMVVGVSVDTDPAEVIAAWVAERGIEYPIALGDHDLAMRFGVVGFPTLLVIDPDGGIHTQHIGVLSRPELEEILDEIRSEQSAKG